MTTDELLAECRAARPEMEWTAHVLLVEGERFGLPVWVTLTKAGVRAFVLGGGFNAPTVAEALDGLAKLVELDRAAAEARATAAGKMLAALAAPLSPYRCAACAWPLAQSSADGCVPGDCCRRGGAFGPHNPIEPKRYAREQGQ